VAWKPRGQPARDVPSEGEGRRRPRKAAALPAALAGRTASGDAARDVRDAPELGARCAVECADSGYAMRYSGQSCQATSVGGDDPAAGA
jgi:hypothetical protein